MKKMKLVLLLILLVFFISGCSASGFDNVNIMRPPRATGDKAEIQKLIEERSGGDYTLKYPQNGDYRSAIISCDLDSDGSAEAIALYSPQNEEAGIIHMLIIDDVNGKMTAVDEFTSTNTIVERVCVTDINGNGIKEIIVGWSNYGSTINQLTAYSLTNGSAKQIPIEETYSDIALLDINSDKTTDIVLLSLGSAEVTANARILKLADSSSSIYATATVEMNPGVTKYSHIQTGMIADGTPGIVVDGLLNDATLTTEVLYLDTKTNVLKNPLYSASAGAAVSNVNIPTRTINTLSKDINKDGIIEFPVTLRLPSAIFENRETVCNAFDWSNINTKTELPETACTTIADYNNGYYFIVPPTWHSKYTAIYNSQDVSVTFYHWDSKNKNGSAGSAFLKLRVFDDDVWNTDGKEYNIIYRSDNKTFAYRTLCEEQDYMYLSNEQIKSNFSLIENNE